MLSNIQVKSNILEDVKYKYLFSVEEVNKLVLAGMPFRDAYKKVGEQIERGEFTYNTKIKHTHEGSIGNLCNDRIKANFETNLSKFNFAAVDSALQKLMEN
jgi:argininosuccinate lyase